MIQKDSMQVECLYVKTTYFHKEPKQVFSAGK